MSMINGWVRVGGRTLVNSIDGRLSAKEQADFRRQDGQKGEYSFCYSHTTGRTYIRIIEHPEWTGEFAKRKGAGA